MTSPHSVNVVVYAFHPWVYVNKSYISTSLSEVKETSEQTKSQAKNEKESRRNLELRLVALEDEISDLKVEKKNLEKVTSIMS